MIELIIIVVVLLIYFFMKRQKNVYDVAYDLGTGFLNNIDYSPNYAVMFDIDDTLIFSNGKPITPIIKLIKECNKRGIKVLIITARDSRYTSDTIEQLMENDIYPSESIPEFTNLYNYIDKPRKAVFYDFIYLRHSPQENNDHFKSKVKENLAEHGLFTIMSIGDNEIDVLGDYSGYAIKLPNFTDPRLFHKNNLGQMVHVKV